jgi:hypothetical protein
LDDEMLQRILGRDRIGVPISVSERCRQPNAAIALRTPTRSELTGPARGTERTTRTRHQRIDN